MSISEYGIARAGLSGPRDPVRALPGSRNVLNLLQFGGDPRTSPGIDFIPITSFGDFQGASRCSWTPAQINCGYMSMEAGKAQR